MSTPLQFVQPLIDISSNFLTCIISPYVSWNGGSGLYKYKIYQNDELIIRWWSEFTTDKFTSFAAYAKNGETSVNIKIEVIDSDNNMITSSATIRHSTSTNDIFNAFLTMCDVYNKIYTYQKAANPIVCAGSELYYRMHINSYPKNINIYYDIDTNYYIEDILEKRHSNNLNLENITTDYNNKVIKCIATYGGKTITETSTLTVQSTCILTAIIASISPRSPTVSIGDDITLTCTASGGNQKYTYQWYKNSIAISGATSNTYTIFNAVSTQHNERYKCTVVSGTETKTTREVYLVVEDSGTLTASISPTSPTVSVGGDITLTCTASGGNQKYTYQWYKNSEYFLSTKSNTYTISNAVLTQNGKKYKCKVVSGTNTKTTDEVTLTVKDSGTLTASISPTSPTVSVGSDITLTCTASGGNQKYTYQWYKNSTVISDATSNIYTIFDAVSTQNGEKYKCTVVSGTETKTTNEVVLTVEDSGTLTASISPTSPTVSIGDDITLTCTASGGNQKYTYQWYKNSTAISNATSNKYTISDVTGEQNGEKYKCTVVSGTKTKTTNEVTLTVKNSGTLTVSISPTSPTVNIGDDITLTCTASGGNQKYTYQWYKNSTAISNATSNKYTISDVTEEQNGEKYKCTVVSGTKTKTTDEVTLTVKNSGALTVSISPTSPTVSIGDDITLTCTASGGNQKYTYQWYKNSKAISNATSNIYTISDVTEEQNGEKYKCTVVSGTKTKTTDEVTLTVKNSGALTVSISPTSPTVSIGDDITLTCTASGGNQKYTYQWYKNSKAISNATSNTYTISDVTEEQNGEKYKCTVVSGTKTKTTNEVTLTVEESMPSYPSCTSAVPPASLLASEFYNLQDMDGNEKIYGYDFKITDDEIHKPPWKPILLILLESSPYWKNPTETMTWKKYLDSITSKSLNITIINGYSISTCFNTSYYLWLLANDGSNVYAGVYYNPNNDPNNLSSQQLFFKSSSSYESWTKINIPNSGGHESSRVFNLNGKIYVTTEGLQGTHTGSDGALVYVYEGGGLKKLASFTNQYSLCAGYFNNKYLIGWYDRQTTTTYLYDCPPSGGKSLFVQISGFACFSMCKFKDDLYLGGTDSSFNNGLLYKVTSSGQISKVGNLDASQYLTVYDNKLFSCGCPGRYATSIYSYDGSTLKKEYSNSEYSCGSMSVYDNMLFAPLADSAKGNGKIIARDTSGNWNTVIENISNVYDTDLIGSTGFTTVVGGSLFISYSNSSQRFGPSSIYQLKKS